MNEKELDCLYLDTDKYLDEVLDEGGFDMHKAFLEGIIFIFLLEEANEHELLNARELGQSMARRAT